MKRGLIRGRKRKCGEIESEEVKWLRRYEAFSSGSRRGDETGRREERGILRGRNDAYLLRLEEILCIRKEQFFHTRIQDDGGHGTLVSGVGPSPATMRVCEIDLNAMYSLCFVLFLCLQDELFEDRVVAGDDGDGEDFTVTAICLATPSDAEPVALVVYGVCCIGSGLEDDAGLYFSGDVFVFFIVVAERVIRYTGTEARSGSASCCLELSGTLPLGTTGKP